jgi:hypothetical protein
LEAFAFKDSLLDGQRLRRGIEKARLFLFGIVAPLAVDERRAMQDELRIGSLAFNLGGVLTQRFHDLSKDRSTCDFLFERRFR